MIGHLTNRTLSSTADNIPKYCSVSTSLFEVKVVSWLEGEGVARQKRVHLSRIELDRRLPRVQHS